MKVLIATDGSEFAELAMKDLLRAGIPKNFEAIVLSVADVWLPPGHEQSSVSEEVTETVKRARERVKFALGQAQEIARVGAEHVMELFPGSNVIPEAMADSPGWGIIARAEKWRADLIVIGSQGLTGLSRLILGSVSQKVVTHSHCPVRIGRAIEKLERKEIRIILGMDGSPGAKHATDIIASRQWPSGTEVKILSILGPRLSTASIAYMPTTVNWIQESYRDEEAWLRTILKEESEKLRNAGLNVTEHILIGNPTQILIENAENMLADCIFVGARGLNRIERFLLGSVSSAVSSRAHCSVEVVKQ